MRTRIVFLGVCMAFMVTNLTACTPGPSTESPTAQSPTPQSSTAQSPTPSPPPLPVFGMPADCAAMIGPELGTTFASSQPPVVLFDSTDGEGIYSDPSREPVQSGGDPIFCLYGQDGVDLSSFQLEVQPVSSTDEHEGIVAVLSGEGFDESTDGDTVTFVRVGDEAGTGSVIHVLRQDSWFTATSTYGGPTNIPRLTGYLDQVAATLYQ